jgi:sulfoxide reductase catalytic subunit YedY
MLIKKPDDIRPSEITDPAVYKARRRFLLGAGALLGLGGGGSLLALGRRPADTGPERRPEKIYQGLPKGYASGDETPTDYGHATAYNNFYELGTGKGEPAENARHLVTDPWSVTVSGECERPGTLTLEDFLKPHDLEERVYRLRCVETWSMVIPWVGFSLGDALKRFQPTRAARFVEFRSLLDPERLPGQGYDLLDWPYREGLRMDEAMHPLATLAVGMYGEVLPAQNGAPLRLVVPWKYGFKSIKSIVSIRFTRQRPATSWNLAQPREYGFYANVNPHVRHPRWSQARERRLGEWGRRDTLPFNGYAEQVADLYRGMDLVRDF